MGKDLEIKWRACSVAASVTETSEIPAWAKWNDETIPKLLLALDTLDGGVDFIGRSLILADALEEAGYPIQSVIDHLRSDLHNCWCPHLVLLVSQAGLTLQKNIRNYGRIAGIIVGTGE